MGRAQSIRRALMPATLVIGAGQSNCSGWATDGANITALTNGNGYIWYPTATTAGQAFDGELFPLSPYKLGRPRAGPQCAFAQTWAAATGGPVIWVDCAVGGSSMDTAAKTTLTGANSVSISGGTWDLSDGANIYLSWCAPTVRAAIGTTRKNGFEIKAIVVLWVQGEQDAGANALTNGATYRTKLNALIAKFVADFGISCFMISKTTANVDPASFTSYLTDIRAAQDNVVADNPTLCPAAWDTANYFNSGWYVDTQHYTAAGYNDLGAGLATAGLALLGNPQYAVSVSAKSAKFSAIANEFPYIPGWWRVRLTHVCSGTWQPQMFSIPGIPLAPTWIDGSGVNKSWGQGGTNPSWSWPSADAKQACLYLHSSVGTSASFIGMNAANARILRVELLDKGFKINRWSPSAGGNGAYANGFYISDIDALRFNFVGSAPIIEFFTNTGPTTPVAPKLALTDAALEALPSGCNFSASGPSNVAYDLSQPGGSNIKTYTNAYNSLSVSQVNAALQVLDANGFSGGSITLLQYSAALGTAAAAPTGAGVTAKTNLQSRSNTVTTD